jgi:hypothetical protein
MFERLKSLFGNKEEILSGKFVLKPHIEGDVDQTARFYIIAYDADMTKEITRIEFKSIDALNLACQEMHADGIEVLPY